MIGVSPCLMIRTAIKMLKTYISVKQLPRNVQNGQSYKRQQGHAVLWVAGEGSAQDPAITTLMPMPMPIPCLFRAFAVDRWSRLAWAACNCNAGYCSLLPSSPVLPSRRMHQVECCSFIRCPGPMIFFSFSFHSIPLSSVYPSTLLDQSYSLHLLYIHVPVDH